MANFSWYDKVFLLRFVSISQWAYGDAGPTCEHGQTFITISLSHVMHQQPICTQENNPTNSCHGKGCMMVVIWEVRDRNTGYIKHLAGDPRFDDMFPPRIIRGCCGSYDVFRGLSRGLASSAGDTFDWLLEESKSLGMLRSWIVLVLLRKVFKLPSSRQMILRGVVSSRNS